MSTALENLNLEEGKSEALRNVLCCISEASATDGGPRYSSRVCRALARIVVCRSYAKPLMELSHLLVCASARDGQFENVFWGIERASVGEFRRVFADFKDMSPHVVVSSSGVILRHPDSEFQVSYGRMPFLAGLLEFMIMAVGFTEIDDLTKSLRKEKPDHEAVLDVAKSLQRCLYQFLKDHIPPAQRQRRERHFLNFVADNCGNRSGADAISDDIVLGYWVAFSQTDDIEAKTYRGVYETARRLIIALDGAQDRLAGSRALSVGTDFEAGEIDPADFEAVTALLDENENPLSRVMEKCAEQVKFINAQEAETLSEMPLGDGTARRIPVSVLRNAVFGDAQLRLTTALRRKTALENLLPDEPDGFYRTRLRGYRDTIANTERLALAALWLLHEHQCPEAIELALKLAPDLDWEDLLGRDAMLETSENVVSLSQVAALQKFYNVSARSKGNELEALLAEAKRAWRGVNRTGFKGTPAPDVVEIVQDVVPDVIRLIEAVHRFLDREAGHIDWAHFEEADKQTFATTLNVLYHFDDEVVNNAC